ncbi:MAG: LAGLIDADG family homing endonuclease, partial [Candidatus Nanoarchaeia archaeon]|nr:LAGLIDADG family homing endonuclease [Candidatus Nanoarchaeia archaeon]
MSFDIVLGRSAKDYKKYGIEASMLIGKHYVTMGKTVSLANDIYVDVNGSHVILICGKRGGGKCLEENTLITLDDGREVAIKDLFNESSNIMGLDNDFKIKSRVKDGFFKRTANDLMLIKLKSGKELKLTSEHPLLTIKGWVALKDLIKGSRIGTPRVMNCFGSKELRECEVKLLAYLLSEGHLSNGFVLFSNFDKELIKDFTQSVKEFDKELKVLSHGHGSYRVSAINKKYSFNENNCIRNNDGQFIESNIKADKSSLTKWLINQKVYDKLSLDKIIPESIFTAPKRQIALFLNRLFSGDGSVYKKKYSDNKSYWRISYASSSKILIYQVQSLLLRFGILSKIREKKIKYLDENKVSYELEINRQNTITYINEINFFSSKQKIAEVALKESENIIFNPNIDTIPKEIWNIFKPKNWAAAGKMFNYSTPKSLRSNVNYAPSRQKLMQLAFAENNYGMLRLANSDIFWDEIESITPIAGEHIVYDLPVPGVHNFVANNIIVHNSYTMGVMTEAILSLPQVVRENIGMIFFDTMGLYWTTKYPNYRQSNDLMEWNLGPKGFA